MSGRIEIETDVMKYLSDNIEGFDPNGSDANFIKDKLALNMSGKVEIKGILLIPMMLLIVFGIVLRNQIIAGFIVGDVSLVLVVSLIVLGILLSNIISGIIWSLYIISSKKVKYTYVE